MGSSAHVRQQRNSATILDLRCTDKTRSCVGIIGLKNSYGPKRLKAACVHALEIDNCVALRVKDCGLLCASGPQRRGGMTAKKKSGVLKTKLELTAH